MQLHHPLHHCYLSSSPNRLTTVQSCYVTFLASGAFTAFPINKDRIKRFLSRYPWLWSWLLIDEPAHPFIADRRARIFLLSFAMLFFELLCIRWVPSYVRYLSYFNNFILLASFLGIGLGMLAARRNRFWFPPFPLLVLILAVIVGLNKFQLHINSTQVLYYGAGEAHRVSFAQI